MASLSSRKEHVNCTQSLELIDLPPEILLHIFSFLPQASRCHSVSLVCRQWHQLTYHPSLWKRLTIRNSNIMKRRSVYGIIARSKALKILDLSHMSDVSDIIVKVGDHCPLLTHLNLGFDEVDDESKLKQLTEKCPNIENLNLEGADTHFESQTAFFPVVNLPHLVNLNVSHCAWVNDEFIYHLTMSSCKLESLNIEGIPSVSDDSMTLFLDKKGHHMKELMLDGEGLTKVSYMKIAMCKLLEILTISFSENVTDDALLLFKDLQNLIHLRIRKGTNITSSGIIETLSSPKLTQLRHLNLSECPAVRDDVLKKIAPNLPALESFDISWCFDVSDYGLVCIIRHCPQLAVVTATGLVLLTRAALEEIPANLPNLRVLDLRHCNCIKDEDIIKLTQQKRGMQISNYYGTNFS